MNLRQIGVVILGSFFVAACASTPDRIDPEAQKAFVDDGTDYYLADQSIEESVGIHHNQWETDADGNEIYPVQTLPGRYNTHYYIGDIRYFNAISGYYASDINLFSIDHPRDRPHWLADQNRNHPRNTSQAGWLATSPNVGIESASRIRRNIPRAISSGGQSNDSSPAPAPAPAPRVSAPPVNRAPPPAPRPSDVSRERSRGNTSTDKQRNSR